MKKKIVVLMLGCMLLGIGACDNKEGISNDPIVITESSSGDVGESQNQTENDDQEQTESANDDQDQVENTNDKQIENGNGGQADGSNASGPNVEELFANGVVESDFDSDYNAVIMANVHEIASSSASIQEELNAVAKFAGQFDKLVEAAKTQYELNQSTKWLYVVWDTELNDLWNRISIHADEQTKESLLSEQRKWVSMKEEATGEYIGSQEDNGSMYPTLQSGFWEKITKNRVYVLANELAKIKGESFNIPERDAKYNICVDDQGTDNVYSSLVTRQSMEGKDEAIISLFRTGEIRGTFEDQGNGKLAFTSDDKKVQGIILLKGWDGASFEVTAVDGSSIVAVGDIYDFDFAF